MEVERFLRYYLCLKRRVLSPNFVAVCRRIEGVRVQVVPAGLASAILPRSSHDSACY